jgi:type IV secretory pathway VirD2 relaxase
MHLARQASAMSEDKFQVRVGKIRSQGARRARTFVGLALAAAHRAGGLPSRAAARTGRFGLGRAASLRAQAGLAARSRRVVVKARVVRSGGRRAPLGVHLGYLQREGVTRDGDRGQVFDADRDAGDARAFVERCEGDRHHFRFIISPEDADRLSDLRAYTRDLMRAAEQDLGTGLDWVAVDHWNTAQPHVHVLVRGRRDDGQDLVISRDYIAEGLRARARELANLELGLRSDQEIRRDLDAQVGAERWTRLDRGLAAQAGDAGDIVDVRGSRGDELRTLRMARLHKLQALGLATEEKPGRWRLSPDAEPTLRALGQRHDIIARLHRAMTGRDADLAPADLVADPPAPGERLVGRLTARGLDDELAGTAYAVVEGLDGRVRHVPLADLADASDAPLGAIVEVGAGAASPGRRRRALWVRSDLGLEAQVRATGATWLDRQLVGRDAAAPSSVGFGREVRAALDARIDHLEAQGLARRTAGRVIFARDLIQTLRQRELAAASAQVAARTGHEPMASGEGAISGAYRQRLNLASGRFAVIEGAMGFTLVPWRPELERHLGRQVEGLRAPDGRVDWSFTRSRGLGR